MCAVFGLTSSKLGAPPHVQIGCICNMLNDPSPKTRNEQPRSRRRTVAATNTQERPLALPYNTVSVIICYYGLRHPNSCAHVVVSIENRIRDSKDETTYSSMYTMARARVMFATVLYTRFRGNTSIPSHSEHSLTNARPVLGEIVHLPPTLRGGCPCRFTTSRHFR